MDLDLDLDFSILSSRSHGDTADGSTDTATRHTLTTALFGDHYGLLLFFGAVTFAGLFWHIGVFINDNYTIANALYNLANGHFAVTDIIYGPESGVTPGMVTNNGQRYGRNYGQLFLTLPVVYALRGLTTVGDLRIGLIGLWCLSLLATCYQVGRILNRELLAARVGAILALGIFALNTAVATQLDDKWITLLALQLTSILAAAFVAVLTYRLLTRIHTRRIGLAAGLAIVFATPVSFWAAIPKRHTYMAALVLAVVYSFYRSRETAAATTALRFRALAYAFVGLATWLQAGEALVIFVALVAVDLLTAESNSPRELAVVGGVFGLSLLPFMLTNLLIAGNPFSPPLFLPRYTGPESLVGSPSTSPGSSPGTGSSAQPVWIALLTSLQVVANGLLESIDQLAIRVEGGLRAALEPQRLYHVFIRGGYIEEVARKDLGHAINLSLLESAPIFAALVVLPKALYGRVRDGVSVEIRRLTPHHATDVLVAGIAVLFSLFYLRVLPLHVMITVRYLLPVMPLLLYAVFRFRAVHDLLTYPRTLGIAFTGTVCIGVQLLVVLLILLDTNLGEAAQVHAWLNLTAATLLALWLLVQTRLPERYTPVGAAILGVTAGVTTNFLLLAGVVYFALEPGFVLPIIELLSERVGWF
ncbi:hypothetical protein SAMN04487950_0530 [Halogranum rubrum]|uniref:Glycosyltransferase RgtA/B/C/D-like domain-containing protein n=1 Tax=Halogranum rubrum TaxID=553466 RepID=A0A1I4BFH4_9EURY|nr:hypothetical protein [Halogranum rubrum]SFK67622.1 hypothetical protein SAMN04487950_0530 [Halogranum rubrum]